MEINPFVIGDWVLFDHNKPHSDYHDLFDRGVPYQVNAVEDDTVRCTGIPQFLFAHRFIKAVKGAKKKAVDPNRPKNLKKWAKAAKIANYSRLSAAQLLVQYQKYKPEEELYPRIKKKLGMLNNWVCQYEDGEISEKVSAPCYAALHYSKGKRSRMCVDVALGVRDGVNQAGYKTFLNYFFNRSPFAHLFITKDADTAITNGVYIDVDQNFNHIVAALIDMRQPYEHKHTHVAFLAFLKAGLQEREAHLLSRFFKSNNMNGFSYSPTEGHSAFTRSMNADDLANLFYNGKFANTQGESFRNSTDRYQIFTSIARQEGVPLNTFFKTKQIDAGWGGKISITPVEQIKQGLESLKARVVK